MRLTIKEIFENASEAISKSDFKKAIDYYKLILETEPENDTAYLFLGLTYRRIGKLEEAKKSYKKVIELKPNLADPYYNLGNIFYSLNKLDEAKENYQKAIKFKPDFAYAYYNLGNVFFLSKSFHNAKENYKKAIKYKPDYTDAYFNLGNTLKDLGELNDAEINFKKVLSLQPKYPMQDSLLQTLKFKKLLSNIKQSNKNEENTIYNLHFASKPFIGHRPVEKNLIKYLYAVESRKFDETSDARYGEGGRCSLDFDLFDHSNPIIKNLSKDLIELCEKQVNSKIHVFDSFFNILNTSGGTTPHAHLTEFDRNLNYVNRKYSLVYYVTTGDQKCSSPGILKLYDPNNEILPKDGMIVIIPANQKHSATYNGKTDRILVGINFYCV